MTIPLFEHDCKSCRYLGIYMLNDLYFCGHNAGNIRNEHATVIARYGDDCGDYSSGLIFACRDGRLKEATRRAINQGLLSIELYEKATNQKWID